MKRETGKVIRIVSRGSVSFANILRYSLFNIIPTFVELVLVLTVLTYMYKWYFAVITAFFVSLYIIATFIITEWRAKNFKSMNQKDNEYNQKATDSLLNFETVKYFNAEKHEAERYGKAL